MAATGRVKFFNLEKGYGFIETEKGDVFVHVNDVAGNPLQEGDDVYFDEEFDQMKQKTKAANVQGGTGQKGFGGGKKGKSFGKGKGDSYGGKSYGGKGGFGDFGGKGQYGGGFVYDQGFGGPQW